MLIVRCLLKTLLILILLVSSSHSTEWKDDPNMIAVWNTETGSGTDLIDQTSNSHDGDFTTSGDSPTWTTNLTWIM